jgi:hypothetical protein
MVASLQLKRNGNRRYFQLARHGLCELQEVIEWEAK